MTQHKLKIAAGLILFGFLKFYLFFEWLKLCSNRTAAVVMESTVTVLLIIVLIKFLQPIVWKKNNGLIGIGWILSCLILFILANNVYLLFDHTKMINEQNLKQVFKGVPAGLVLLATGILSPIYEELIFRRGFQDRLLGNSWLAIVIVSIIFVLLHQAFTPYTFLVYFTMSLILGLLYKKIGLYGAVLFHIINNLMA